MLRKRLPVLFSLLVFGGCLRPAKPVVEVCSIDFPANEGICALTGQGANTHSKREPLVNLDKATAFKPVEWKKVKNYYDLLEAYANDLETHCK